jgi:GntR family transcriptional regulator/MocR family aminotransferase
MNGMHVASGTVRASERVLSHYKLLADASSGDQTKQAMVYRALRETIRRLDPGQRLPTAGELASPIGVSRGTVLAVYQRLAAEGYVKLVGRFGAFINHFLPSASAGGDAGAPPRDGR